MSSERAPVPTRPLQRHEGSFHCGAVRFAIEADFPVRATVGVAMA